MLIIVYFIPLRIVFNFLSNVIGVTFRTAITIDFLNPRNLILVNIFRG